MVRECGCLPAQVSADGAVRFVADFFLREKFPAMLAAHATVSKQRGGVLTLRYEAVASGGANRDHTLRQLLYFLGLPEVGSAHSALEKTRER